MNRSLFALCAAICAAPASAQLVDGGYETSTPTQMIPDAFGVWGFDRASTTGATQGVTPFEGDLMLSIEGTSPICAPNGGTSGAVGQLVPIDLVPTRGIKEGIRVTASAMFNRVAGADADTEFQIRIAALDGEPSTYPTGCGTVRPALASTSSSFASDDDLMTWEMTSTTMILPPDTTFIAVIVSAQENVVTDDSPPFTGHFVDDVQLIIEYPPCSAADLAPPFSILDFSDALEFLRLFDLMDARADFAAPFGVWDFTDIIAFLEAFEGGCPVPK